MKRASLLVGLLLLAIGWAIAMSGLGMAGHMAGHMIAVALAAPLLAFGLNGTVADPAARWPRIVSPLYTMLAEMAVVWIWHLPALRAAAQIPAVMAVEQGCFLLAGFALWAAVIHAPQRVVGVGALLITSMHMTLLGVLIGLAPRPLYPDHHHGLDPLVDQQIGGVVMLMIGAASYLIGGLALLSNLLHREGPAI